MVKKRVKEWVDLVKEWVKELGVGERFFGEKPAR